MTPFEHDMGEMVREARSPESKKSLAMNYVRATGKIANGHRGNVEALCDAMIAQTPIMLEMYLERHVLPEDLTDAIDEHLRACPLSGRDQAHSEPISSMSWQRLVFAVATNIKWPGALVITVLVLRDPLCELLQSLIR